MRKLIIYIITQIKELGNAKRLLVGKPFYKGCGSEEEVGCLRKWIIHLDDLNPRFNYQE